MLRRVHPIQNCRSSAVTYRHIRPPPRARSAASPLPLPAEEARTDGCVDQTDAPTSQCSSKISEEDDERFPLDRRRCAGQAGRDGARVSPLKVAIRDYAHTRALKDGTIAPEGCELDFVEVEPIHRAFAPMVRELRYDVSELAVATLSRSSETRAANLTRIPPNLMASVPSKDPSSCDGPSSAPPMHDTTSEGLEMTSQTRSGGLGTAISSVIDIKTGTSFGGAHGVVEVVEILGGQAAAPLRSAANRLHRSLWSSENARDSTSEPIRRGRSKGTGMVRRTVPGPFDITTTSSAR